MEYVKLKVLNTQPHWIFSTNYDGENFMKRIQKNAGNYRNFASLIYISIGKSLSDIPGQDRTPWDVRYKGLRGCRKGTEKTSFFTVGDIRNNLFSAE